MKIIIIGVGKVGGTLAESLVSEGHDVFVIDKDEKAVSDIVNHIAANGIAGAGLSRAVLDNAGVNTADFVISCTPQDETNILCCVLAKKLGVKRTVARVRDPQYFNEIESLQAYLGLDMIFNPDRRAAIDITEVLNFPSAKSVESFANGKAVMAEFEIEEDNPLAEKSLKQIAVFGFNVLFGMVKRGEQVFIPRGDFVVKTGDSIYVIAPERQIALFCKKLRFFKPRAKNVVIVGGGKVGFYLAQMLQNGGTAVKIIEKDLDRCEFLSENLTGVTVINGNATKLEVLDGERIGSADAVVTLTGIDEENVIISLYAEREKVDKVITKVSHSSVEEMVKTLGLDTVISPIKSITNHILRFVRANSFYNSGDLKSLYKLRGGAEASEFMVTGSFPYADTPLAEYEIKRDVLIGGIIRSGEFIVPRGNETLKVGDSVIVVSATKKVERLEGILK